MMLKIQLCVRGKNKHFKWYSNRKQLFQIVWYTQYCCLYCILNQINAVLRIKKIYHYIHTKYKLYNTPFFLFPHVYAYVHAKITVYTNYINHYQCPSCQPIVNKVHQTNGPLCPFDLIFHLRVWPSALLFLISTDLHCDVFIFPSIANWFEPMWSVHLSLKGPSQTYRVWYETACLFCIFRTSAIIHPLFCCMICSLFLKLRM